MSVVIPARDAADTLGRQLDALAAQDYTGRWEVVVVDDGSADGTAGVAESRRPVLPALRVVRTRGSGGVNRARNAGCRHSRGRLLLFCDADDLVTPGWMSALVRALEGAPAAGGALERRALNGAAALAARPPSAVPRLADSFAFLPYPWGANCGVRREVWERLDGFDPSYTYGSDDVEFFWRAQLSGAALVFVPDAVVLYQLRERPWDMARQYFRYGRSHPMLYRRFAADGMPRSSSAEAYREWGRLLLRACALPRSPTVRAQWLVRAALRAGRLSGSLRHRVVYL
ncbi:glycosyltransferase [Streptomyces sulfonofaciens]|uniref:glycosyltransferase n=1 Tax=Streptomyces sulfonofaciens TaxID=68272 RepID=UPI001678EB77|nr:glycosyltransferase family A protein [Streptomyces sulfonofaciens]